MKLSEILLTEMPMDDDSKPTDKVGDLSDQDRLDILRAKAIDGLKNGQPIDLEKEMENLGFVTGIPFEDLIGHEEMEHDDKATIAKAMVGQKVLLTFGNFAKMFESDLDPDGEVYIKDVCIEAVIKRFVPDFKGGLSKKISAIYDQPGFEELKKHMHDNLHLMQEERPGGIEVEFPEPASVEYSKDLPDGDVDIDAQGEAHKGLIALGQIYSIMPADSDEVTHSH